MPLRCKCKAMQQIGYCLIRAKVDLEYGMGLTKNPYLLDAMMEIEKALDWTFVEEDADNET